MKTDCMCRNLADEDMPPFARIGDAEAKRRGLWLTTGCRKHAPTAAPTGPEPRTDAAVGSAESINEQGRPDYVAFAAKLIAREIAASAAETVEADLLRQLRARCRQAEHDRRPRTDAAVGR